jgi:SAM-dependent methyltransferase
MSLDSANYSRIKKTEAETLRTFQEEIPSIYFSDKTERDYADYRRNAEYIYRDLFKFPPKMFEGTSLIDFGAGTGENTIYLANWGASCTLVEMNELAQNISKEVFRKYAGSNEQHRFVHSSIFDYAPAAGEQYDIVHCRGVLSHTAAKEEAFRKISTFLKPGGYLIFGDPNKAGGFQNMLQRFAVYRFAKTPDEMVEVSERLFKDDIDRSQSFVPRTRRSIIFDRWVIQSQDDPSVAEVVRWAHQCGLRLYSAYPPVLLPLLGDSIHHQPKFDPYAAGNLFAISELVWMLHTEADAVNMDGLGKNLAGFSERMSGMTSYMANFNVSSRLDIKEFRKLSGELQASVELVHVLDPIKEKLSAFLDEANAFVKLVLDADIEAVREFVVSTRVLFKGACGVRHVDFIAYKPL